jgi:hypothetical protein
VIESGAVWGALPLIFSPAEAQRCFAPLRDIFFQRFLALQLIVNPANTQVFFTHDNQMQESLRISFPHPLRYGRFSWGWSCKTSIASNELRIFMQGGRQWLALGKSLSKEPFAKVELDG